MNQIKASFLLLFVLFACALAWGGGGQGQGQGQNYGGMMGGGFGGGQGRQGRQGFQGSQGQGFDGPMGYNGRQMGGGFGDSKKYRSNLYNDEDVYGYDATYPNGEAAYINYRSKDARSRRGPEFARTSRAYSRQGGRGGSGGQGGADRVNSYGQMQDFGGNMW